MASKRAWSFQWLGLLAMVLATCLVSGCSNEPGPSKGEGEPAAAPATAPVAAPAAPSQIDLAGVMRRVRLRFTPDGDAWTGQQPSYAVRVTADELRVTPRVPSRTGRVTAQGADFVAGAASIERRGAAAAARAGVVRGDKGIERHRGLATEIVENTDEGVEQSFRFDARPAGSGDVTVRIPVSGQRYAGASDEGLHFVDDATGLGVRYGAATWIDARGERTSVAAAFDAGAIALTLPAALVERSAYPAVLDPTIGPELGMDSPIYGNATGTQGASALLYAGGQHLVVWVENPLPGFYNAVFATRVSGSGTILDPYGILVSNAVSNKYNLAVGSDGSNFLITWIDSRASTNDVYAARVSAAGACLDPGGAPIVTGAGFNRSLPVVSYGGGQYLVSYRDNSQVKGQLVSTAAALVGAPFMISNYNPAQMVASFNGTEHLVAFSNGASLFAHRVTAAGVPTGSDIAVVNTNVYGNPFGIATNGTDWLIGFIAMNASSQPIAIRTARVTAAGVSTDVAGGGVLISSSVTNVYDVSVAFDGATYGIFWSHTPAATVEAYGARYNAVTNVIAQSATQIVAEIGNHLVPLVSYDTANGNYFLVFYDDRLSTASNPYDIRYSRLSSALTKLESPTVLVTKGANQQVNAASAFNGTSWLVVWEDSRGTNTDVWGTRLDANGNVLDPNGIAISLTAQLQARPVVASNGVDWVVAWEDNRNGLSANGDSNIYLTRVLAAGTVSDPSGVFVGIGNVPAVASSAGSYLITWSWYDPALNPHQRLIASRYNAVTNSVTDVGAPLAIAQISSQFAPSAVAFNGTSWLVAYVVNGGPVAARRVTTGGSVQDAGGITLSFSTAVSSPTVAAVGTQWIVGWEEATDIHACRVSSAGSALDVGGFTVASAAGSQTAPRAASDGAQYWLAWEDPRAGVGLLDVYGARVSTAGAVVDVAGIPLATDLVPELGANLSGGPAGKLLLTYHRYGYAPSTDGERVFGRILAASGGGGSVCSLPSDCGSGFCVDGVCCDLACTGACQACTAAKKGAGIDGACGPIKVDTDPDNECTDQGSPSCGTNGLCDGAGACKLYAAGASCGAGICAGSVATPKICNGTGSCVNGAGSDCAPYNCAGGACKNPCVIDADCVGGNVCVAGVCTMKIANGGVCSSGAQCQSSFCVDGVCCNSLCTGVCQACTAAKKGGGADGTCGSIGAGLDPDSECAPQAQSTCGTDGACNGSGACELWASGTSCGAATCQGNVVKSQVCNGGGSCGLGAGGQDCAPYACANGACKNTCATTADCAAGFICSGNACTSPAANGSACSTGTDCQSGFCVDGVCCNTICLGLCNACTAAKKGSGVNGVCGSIGAGLDPDNECALQAQSTCGQTGACDGASACQLYASGTGCGSPLCVGNVVKAKSCDGVGTCGLAPGGQDCAPYACSNGACKNACAVGADCAAGFVCSMGACVSPLTNGSPCGGNGECQSSFCVDGVCCNTGCGSLCQACTSAKKGAGANGVCGAIVAGSDPDNECSQQAQASCGQNGSCDGAGACQVWAQGTSCGNSSCQGNVVSGHVCNGSGTCVVNMGQDCAPYVCSGGACTNPCGSSSDCVAGFFCGGGQCKPLGSQGTPCASAAQCQSSFCVDGVCCDGACGGACQACSAALKGQGADGACGPVIAGNDPDNECAQQPQSTCGTTGACSGAGSCQLYAAGASCGAGSCANAVETSAAQCDGQGTCKPGSPTACAPEYVCAGSACATDCSDDTSCAQGYACDLGTSTCALIVDGGATGTGGTGGASTGTGGTAGAGTGGATGGAGGTGGASTGTGGATGGTGGTGGSQAGSGGGAAGDKGSCGCRVAGGDDEPGLGAMAALAALALAGARRRRREARG